MSWQEIKWFSNTDVVGTVRTESSTTKTTDSGTMGENGNVPTTDSDVNDGSGSDPVINVVTDYWLRDEDNIVITDENSEQISLEDL